MTKLVKCASTTVMKPEEWDIETWMNRVVREDLSGTTFGIENGKKYASNLNDDLREALWRELSFKSYSEDLAARGLAKLAEMAPNDSDFQYLLTHALDESRHAVNFAKHFYSVYGQESEGLIESLNKEYIDNILTPLKTLFDEYVVEKGNYYCGIAMIAIVLEGVLAPSSELSEIKWLPFDERAAQVQKSANVDEIRHLCVCAEILKKGLNSSQEMRKEIVECIRRGLTLWNEVPVLEMLQTRESLYQNGMRAKLDSITDYKITDDILLKETDQNQRIQIASQWSHMMQYERLDYLGIRAEVENG